ncbi:MAG: branched-chain amino acid ABC transporter permease [Thermodesulfobacteriota bacterium]|jgi:branched-chain amino acid transport system permease protein
MIANIFVIGLLNGCVYALLAAGFSLLFSVARIVNLAYTAFWMVAAYIFLGGTLLGLHPLLAAVISIAATLVMGLLFQRVIDPVKGNPMSVMILTLAIGVILQKAVSFVQDSFQGVYFQIVPSLIKGSTNILGVAVTYQYLLSLFVVIFILAGLWLFLTKTRFGIAVRATSEDKQVAGLMGINEKAISDIVTGIAVGVAAIAGVVVSPLYVLEPWMWLQHLMVLMAVVVFGGLGSLKGSIWAAFIVAFIESFIVFLLPTMGFLRSAIVMFIMIIVLLIRPQGLFGTLMEEQH